MIFLFTLESEIIQCIYFYMLVFIMLNTTTFYVEKRISQLCPKEPHVLSQCTPHWGALGPVLVIQIYSRSTGFREP